MNLSNDANWLPTVVLLHTLSDETSHFDWMFANSDGINTLLRTYRATQNPINTPVGDTIAIIRIQDHRNNYLKYEGKISMGRGEVARADSGQYRQSEPHILDIKWTIHKQDTCDNCSKDQKIQRWMIDEDAKEAKRLK